MFLYSAVSSPLDRSKRFTLFALPGRPVHSDTNSASPGSILVMQQLRATTKSSHFQHCLQPGTHLYSWVDWGIVKRTKMPKLRNGSKVGFEPGLSRLRVRHSTTELPRSTMDISTKHNPYSLLSFSDCNSIGKLNKMRDVFQRISMMAIL